MKRHVLPIAGALAVLTLTAPCEVLAGERSRIPEDRPGPAAYMRLETAGEMGFTDLEWVAIPVYRQIDLIPDDFNLLLFFDNATQERREYAQSVPLYVQGFVIRNPQPLVLYFEDKPDEPTPILFVSWGEFQEETDDGEIYIDELLCMESLQVGMADFYMEEIMLGWTHRIVTSGVIVDGELAGTEFFATYAHGAATRVPKVESHITFGD
jgi:hypothetical protein